MSRNVARTARRSSVLPCPCSPHSHSNDVALAVLAAPVRAPTGSAARLALLPERKVQHRHALCNVETTV